MSVDVFAINLDEQIAILDNEEVVPVAAWVDTFGEDCDQEDAACAIIGPCKEGLWRVAHLNEFEERTEH